MTTPEERLATWQFFLVKMVQQPPTPPQANSHDRKPTTVKAKTLVPLSSTETLASALTGRTVLEFPTLLVMPPGTGVPEGYAIGTFERRIPKARPATEIEGGGDGEGDGDDKTQRHHKHNNHDRKRGFEGRDRQGRKRNRGRGTGANSMGVFDRRGGKGARMEEAHAPIAGQVSVPEEGVPSEGEEGEVNSDGDEVMYDAPDGKLDGLVGVARGDDEAGEDGEGEVREGSGENRPRSGLVDYGSSDESE